jgi:small multidrug resistance pump
MPGIGKKRYIVDARLCIILTLLMSAGCLVGDYFLKRASVLPRPFQSIEFFSAAAVYALSAVVWVIVLPRLKLGAVGIIYGVSTVLFTALLGWLAFGEKLQWHELSGMVLGIISILLLARFA